MSRGGRNTRGRRGHDTFDKQSTSKGERNNKSKRSSVSRGTLSIVTRAKFQRTIFENIEDMKKQSVAIAEFKVREVICPICGKRIEDMISAVSDSQSGLPAHFDCVLNKLVAEEHLEENEQVIYIGQGKFAVVRYKNVDGTVSFCIVRKIECETRGTDIPWRHEISSLYSQVL